MVKKGNICGVCIIMVSLLIPLTIYCINDVRASGNVTTFHETFLDGSSQPYQYEQVTVTNSRTSETLNFNTDSSGEIYYDEDDFIQGLQDGDELVVDHGGLSHYWTFKDMVDHYQSTGEIEDDDNLPTATGSVGKTGEYDLTVFYDASSNVDVDFQYRRSLTTAHKGLHLSGGCYTIETDRANHEDRTGQWSRYNNDIYTEYNNANNPTDVAASYSAGQWDNPSSGYTTVQITGTGHGGDTATVMVQLGIEDYQSNPSVIHIGYLKVYMDLYEY
jgi:hypothetical protein